MARFKTYHPTPAGEFSNVDGTPQQKSRLAHTPDDIEERIRLFMEWLEENHPVEDN